VRLGLSDGCDDRGFESGNIFMGWIFFGHGE
jgi:hypothetical protein